MPTIQELITAITQRAEGRYEVHVPDMNDMVSPSIDFGTAAVRLKRLKLVKAGWRTVLITECPYGVEYIQSAFRWAADVRDMLAEPQTVDRSSKVLNLKMHPASKQTIVSAGR